MKNYLDAEGLQEYTGKLVTKLKTIFPGAPTAVLTAAEMTDHGKVYVYAGTETGYVAGDWYYWDGTAWADGGVYNATALVTDTTLSVSGRAADAAAVGAQIGELKENFAKTSVPHTVPVMADGYVGASGANTGKVVSSTKYVRTELLSAVNAAAVAMTDNTYDFWVSYYDATGDITTGTGYLAYSGRITDVSAGRIHIPIAAKKFAVSVGRTDSAVLSDADKAAILADLTVYAYTDESLALPGIPADAAAVGEEFGETVAPEFSAADAYSEGDYVIYNGALYRFVSDHAAGAWTGKDAQAIRLSDDVGMLCGMFEADGSDPGYVDLTSDDYTLNSNKFIDTDGTLASQDGSYVFQMFCSPGDMFRINARAYQDRYFYAFYTAGNVLISGEKASGSGTSMMDQTELTAPEGTAYLMQAWRPLTGYTRITQRWVVPPVQLAPDATLTQEGKAADAKAAGDAIAAVDARFVPHTNLTKKWAGLKWCVFGDSLTEENARTTKHYFDYISEATGIEIYNMGDSGSGYMNESNLGTAFYQRIGNVPTDCDVITIFGSFNDNNHYSVMGSAGDSGTDTIGGCIRQTFSNLFAAFPLAILGVVTPTPWAGQNPLDPTANASLYNQLIIDSCKLYSIPCMDLFHESNLRPWNSAFRELAYSKDGGGGTHPDETGHAIIAPKFEAFLDRLLLH